MSQIRVKEDSSSCTPVRHLQDGALGAQVSLVNRTHRVVREQARVQSDRRTKVKSLWVPLGLCCAFLIVLSIAAWKILAQNDLSSTGIPDASAQMLILLLWFLPISGALFAAVWFRKAQTSSESESRQ